MVRVRAALARIAGMVTKHRGDDELREELESHLEMETAEYVRRGMRPDAARRQALLASGGLTQAADATRAQRGVPWLESIAADVTYAACSSSHSRIATGIGWSTSGTPWTAWGAESSPFRCRKCATCATVCHR